MADYPAHGLTDWDDELKAFIDGEAIKARARGNTEFWQRFRGAANGSIPAPITGQTVVPVSTPADNIPQIISEKLASAYDASSGTAAWYLQTKLTNQVSRIGARWTIDGSGNGTIGLIAWADDFNLHLSPTVVPDSICHLAISTVGWTYSTVDTSGTFHVSASGTFETPLVMDGATVHTAEVVIDRENGAAYVHLPDGTTATVIDARIKTLDSKWALIEDYRQAPTNSKVRVLEWWADSHHSGEALIAAKLRATLFGAWQNCVLTSPWVAYSGTGFALYPSGLQWRREGASARVLGVIQGGAASGTIATIPFTSLAPQKAQIKPILSGASLNTPATILMQGKSGGTGAQGQLQYLSGGNVALLIDFTYPIG